MYYALIGLLASLQLVITNYDVFLLKNKDNSKIATAYRGFLFSVLAYYITDFFWGILEYFRLTYLLYLDTEFYFIAMASGILFWTRYVIAYLGEKTRFKTTLQYTGVIFFVSVLIATFLNLFFPVMFYFDENGIYHAANLRNTLLIIQIIILFFSSGYVFTVAHKVPERKKPRYITIGSFGIIMLIFISIQFFEPYLPLYGIGYMLGTSLLRTFVVENEKEEYRQDLELALEREEKDLEQLNIAWKAAYTDSLTGAQSKLAYSEKEDLLNKAIDEGEIDKFAIAVFDINGLKQINDSLGHDAGDNLIIEAYNLISCSFPDCLIYRIGGDEFVAIMENDNFDKHEKYIANFENMIKHNSENNGVSVAVGHAEYNKEHDSSTRRVFTRADMSMYENKAKMKEEFEKNQKEK